jgi:hypothetical protein
LLANIDLPLFRRARAQISLGSTPSLYWAKAGVRTVEDSIKAMRNEGKEPGALELKLLADCQNVVEKVEPAEDRRRKWMDLIEEEDDDEEDDVAWPQEDMWSVLASAEPASADVSMQDRRAVKGHTRSSGVGTSSASRTAKADLPTLRPGFVRVPDWITDDMIIAYVRTHGVTAEQLEGMLRMQRIEDQELAVLERSEEGEEGKEDEARG